MFNSEYTDIPFEETLRKNFQKDSGRKVNLREKIGNKNLGNESVLKPGQSGYVSGTV